MQHHEKPCSKALLIPASQDCCCLHHPQTNDAHTCHIAETFISLRLQTFTTLPTTSNTLINLNLISLSFQKYALVFFRCVLFSIICRCILRYYILLESCTSYTHAFIRCNSSISGLLVGMYQGKGEGVCEASSNIYYVHDFVHVHAGCGHITLSTSQCSLTLQTFWQMFNHLKT